jgi:hypothetical protein
MKMKSKKQKNVFLSCVVILVIACVCLSVLLIGGAGISFLWPSKATEADSTPAVNEVTQIITGAEEAETATAQLQTEEPSGDEEALPVELRKAMSKIESQVIGIRGLQPTDPVERDLITAEKLEEIVTTDFFSEYTDEDARKDVLILSALGLLPEEFELKQFYNDLYSEQIAGFYDSEEKEMYVVQGTGFGGYEKMTYAHEYTHVLQDQIYGLEEGLGLDEESCEADSERCAAVTALIEGDATLTELLWFRSYATEQDYEDYNKAFEDFESPVFDSAPPYMAADLYFPYEYGYIFVQLLYNDGGFDAVDAAYQDVPLSTEQILHPEKYPDDKPLTVKLPDLTEVLGEGWTLYDENVMGEWYTYLILNKAYEKAYRLSESIAEEAAAGWGGDAYAFYLNDATDEVVFVMDAVWDTMDDAGEFADAFVDYADLRWEFNPSGMDGYPTWSGENGTIVLLHESDRTLWVLAPDYETAESLLTELQ